MPVIYYIAGNAGCGIWIMAAHQPLIHGNEIHSNRDSGISLVNKMVGTSELTVKILNWDTKVRTIIGIKMEQFGCTMQLCI